MTDFFQEQNFTLDEALEVLLFTIGEAMAQYTDGEVDLDFLTAALQDMTAAYYINCDQEPLDADSTVH